jgi:type I restriction enzyme S subunit
MERIGDRGKLDCELLTDYGAANAGLTIFQNGDVLIAKITPCFENGKGALCQDLPGGYGVGTTELHVLRPHSNLDARFLYYVTTSAEFRIAGAGAMSGAAGQKRVPDDFVRDFRCLMPAVLEQHAICTFLDRETTKIDALIEKKERLITLLEEKRAALITRAVTEGLDRSAPMKDSGMPWTGSIPAHWQVKRLKYAVPAITVGIVVTPAKYYVDEGVLCLRSLNISGRTIDRTALVFISPESNELLSKSQIRQGDVLVVRTGKTGAAVVVPEDLDGANCIDLLMIRRSPSLVSEYLWYLLNSWVTAAQIECFSEGAIQAHYNTSTLAELTVTVPPTQEQKAVVEWLDPKMAVLDALAAKTRQQIAKFQEYRMALISAAVTGKIDVTRCTNDDNMLT